MCWSPFRLDLIKFYFEKLFLGIEPRCDSCIFSWENSWDRSDRETLFSWHMTVPKFLQSSFDRNRTAKLHVTWSFCSSFSSNLTLFQSHRFISSKIKPITFVSFSLIWEDEGTCPPNNMQELWRSSVKTAWYFILNTDERTV